MNSLLTKPKYRYIQPSPSGCECREIPGVTQVEEKGHEGNAAVVTAYLSWREHGQRKSRTGVPADYYYFLRTLHHTRTRTAILLCTIVCFEQYYTRTVILLCTIVCFEQYYTRTAVGRRLRPNHRVVVSFTQDHA